MLSDKYIIANFWRSEEPHKKTPGKLHIVTTNDGDSTTMASVVYPLSRKRESEFLVNIEIIGKPEDKYVRKEFAAWALSSSKPEGIADVDSNLIGEWLDLGNVSNVDKAEEKQQTPGRLHVIEGELSKGSRLFQAVVDEDKTIVAEELRSVLEAAKSIVEAIPVADFSGTNMGSKSASMIAGHLRYVSLRAQVMHDALLSAIEEAEKEN